MPYHVKEFRKFIRIYCSGQNFLPDTELSKDSSTIQLVTGDI